MTQGKDANAQQPAHRPMTVYEMRAVPIFSWVWVETMDPQAFAQWTGGTDASDSWCRKYRDMDDEVCALGWPGICGGFAYSEYGLTWRAWKEMPTFEERVAAKWGGEDLSIPRGMTANE